MKNTGKTIYDVIIIGAGASGMMAAITAAREGARVLILEHKDKIGKKILATGNGKCNYTNSDMSAGKYNGNLELVRSVLSKFSFEQTIEFFNGLGIYPKSKNGYYYPNSEQAQSILTALMFELQKLHIKVCTLIDIRDIDKHKGTFEVYTSDDVFYSKKLIIATGLLANPKLGSDGSIFKIVKELGHRFTPIVPALCGFYCSGLDFKKASGVRTDGEVLAYVDGKLVASDRGEIQFTDYGISGIPVFQISHFLSYALYNKQKCEVKINFFPDITYDKLIDFLIHRRDEVLSGVCALDFMNGVINQKLAKALLAKVGILYEIKAAKISDSDIQKLAKILTSATVRVEKWRDYEFAQVCAGGIRTEDIDMSSLESKIVEGLYFAGEILDVDGICGGYNLQWAWASGFVAGSSKQE